MLLSLTNERSSGEQLSQSTRYWSCPPLFLESRIVLTKYAGDPSISIGGGSAAGLWAAVAVVAEVLAGLKRET